MNASAPAEGTLGIGVGELGINGEFHSIVWFSYADAQEAYAFAGERGYVWQSGVPL